MVRTTVTGLVSPVKSTPAPFILKVKMLFPRGTIWASKLTPLMVPSNENLPVGFSLNEPVGIVTEKVPICKVTSSVTGLVSLVFLARVKSSFRSNRHET
jgi:hypothetical protein